MDIYTIANQIFSLTKDQKRQLINLLKNPPKHNQNLVEERFKNGLFCPQCGGVENIVKYGFKNGHQRFRCKHCGRIFNEVTNSVFMCSKKSFDIWEKYIECMINEFTIRKSAKICGICITTAFVWRHKILDTLANRFEETKLNGIVEFDETFFAISYKGSRHMPRESRVRGGLSIRGISNEQVCVPCAVDRNGGIYGRISNLGRVQKDKLEKMFNNRIEKNSILCSDGEKSYKNLSNVYHYEHIVIKSNKYKNGIYHLNHINSFHSGLKKFIRRFNGVSTKFLNNYIIWNIIIKKGIENMLEVININNVVKYKNFANRPLIPIL